LMLGLRVLDALEYIHCHEYTHGDIKGSNLMMGFSKSKSGQVSSAKDLCLLIHFARHFWSIKKPHASVIQFVIFFVVITKSMSLSPHLLS